MYIILKKIYAQRANFLQTPYLVSPAPVFAATMLGHALSARLGVRDLGVGIVHHYASPHIEDIVNKHEWLVACACQYKGSTFNGKSESVIANPTIAAVTGDIAVSIILQTDRAVSPNKVKDVITSKGIRLAGGIVPRMPQILKADDLKTAILNCGRGFWISDATSLVKQRLAENMPIVDAVMGKVDGGWFVPAVLGYRALTRFEKRHGARDGLDHAYSEAMVGLVRYQSIFSVSQEEGGLPPLWTYQWVNPSTFIVQQKGVNNDD